MAVFQGKARKSPRGSRYKAYRGYKKHELGKPPAMTGLGKKRILKVKSLGGSSKLRLLDEEIANVVDPKT